MFYKLAVFVCNLLMHLLYRVSAADSDKIPKDGAAIICSNHIKMLDPVLVCVSTKRVVHYMGKKELFENKLLAALFRGIKAFPVDRKSGRDVEAMRTAINLLKSGEILGIFFHGHRVKEGEEKAVKSGVILFALKGKAPIVPAYISGEYKIFSKTKIKFGDPIFLDEYYDKKLDQELLEKLTKLVTEKVEALKME